MDPVPGSNIAGASMSLSHPVNNSIFCRMPSGARVKAVKAVTTVRGPARSIPAQPLTAFSASRTGEAEPLPLPQWQSTFNKLGSLVARMDGRWVESDVAQFVKKLDDFHSNVAVDLQKALENDASTEAGWFSRGWTDSYLTSRLPLGVYVSFALKLNLPTVVTGAASGVAHTFYPVSGAVLGAYEHLQMIQEKKLAVEYEKGRALCTSQPAQLFSHRKACQGKDQLIPCLQGKKQHIIVLSKGQPHRLQIADESGRKISLHDLAATLYAINLAPGREDTIDLTPMTSGGRNQCAALQKEFIESSGVNRAVWQQVEEAFCCVCLDDPDGQASGKQLLAGNGSNRCFDKSLQLIAMANGEVGVTIEHTPADAGAWLPLFHRIIQRLSSGKSMNGELLPTVERLVPEVNDNLKSKLASASACFKDLLAQVELKEVTVQNVDQTALKEQAISPDAFYQLVFQLAACHAGYKAPPTYESVSMRQFKYGRTDDLRSFSPEVLTFLTALDNANIPGAKKAELLRKALKAHRQKIKECKAGEGICRHLFALEKKWETLHPEQAANKPGIFADPVYQDLVNRSTLSTSCVADQSISHFVFGPVDNDGLGIAYYPTENDLRMTVSWNKENREKALTFVARLEASVNQLLGMLDIARNQETRSQGARS
ncbi:choline/carnitine O-acyltransferase [Endozoicomonas sp. ONNA2]|uniref:choline/carnitine O-acyltransferase n=1 Tax=Endozoicomonas sp. ONNA2 TaxID=2828741 RepID=UPI002147BEEF|nr:choline/carnitine O-acyltransferase [Endozoicomonas sp. ONNA2]